MRDAKTLRGKRCIALVRCSTSEQAGEGQSTDQQLELLLEFARKHHMIWVAEVRSDGVSSKSQRQDLKRLLNRAETYRDYEVLLIQSFDRFTRRGMRAGLSLLERFRRLGVAVVSILNDMPEEGELGDLMMAFELLKARGYVDSLAQNVTRGRARVRFDGKIPHTVLAPYGLDRLVLDGTNTPKFRLRLLADGSQLQMDPEGVRVLRRFPKTPGEGQYAHYPKQRDEKQVLVPGDATAVATVRTIFDQFYRDRISVLRIAQHLNSKDVPSPRGGLWGASTIYTILLNPTYIGRGIANRLAAGTLYMAPAKRGEAPAKVKHKPKALSAEWETDDETQCVPRPESDWVHLVYQEAAIVAPDLHEVVWRYQYERHSARAAGVKRPYARRPKGDSAFLLEGAIWEKSTGRPLTPRRSGLGARHRSYASARREKFPTAQLAGKSRQMPAHVLETTAIQVLHQVVSGLDRYVPVIRKYVERRCKEVKDHSSTASDLHLELRRLQEKKAQLWQEFQDVGAEHLTRLIRPISAEIASVQDRLKRVTPSAVLPLDSQSVIDAVVGQMRDVHRQLSSGNTRTLAAIVRTMTRTLVDLDTREVEVEVWLPSFLMADPEAIKRMCAKGTSPDAYERGGLARGAGLAGILVQYRFRNAEGPVQRVTREIAPRSRCRLVFARFRLGAFGHSRNLSQIDERGSYSL